MTGRERVLKAIDHAEPDRIPVHDSVWDATVKRWRREGLPEDSNPADYFGFEFSFFGADLTPGFPVRTLGMDDRFIVETTAFGGKRRNFRDYSTTPEILAWPVKCREDWKKISERLKPDFRRVDWATGLKNNRAECERGRFTVFAAPSGYDALQNYISTENLLIAMAAEPDWVKEMVETVAELIMKTADMMIENGFRFDGAFLYNDMGYRNGPLFSPAAYMKTHFEADRMLFEYFRSKGMKTILHSCGRVEELIPMLIEAGLDCLQPLEVKAGMDAVKLKKKYGGRLCLMGGIDVRLMEHPDNSRIEKEIREKFESLKKGGGYIYHSDHSIPVSVSFDRYTAVMRHVRKYGDYSR